MAQLFTVLLIGDLERKLFRKQFHKTISIYYSALISSQINVPQNQTLTL